jgi:cell division protein FtsQ
VTAPTRARKRRKQHAAPRRRGGRGQARARSHGSARRSNARRSRPTQQGRNAKRDAAEPPADAPRFARLRRLLSRKASSAHEATPQAEVREQEPRVWPRRLAHASLKLGAVVAVAWGLLLAGREVYEYSTTSARFEVQHLIYEPTTHVDDEILRELLAIQPGTNILACDLAELSERVAEHPWVALATVTRNLPDTLEVEVIEHRPEAIVLAGRFYLVNEEGRPFKVVERGERDELPIVTGIDREALAAAGEDPVPELVSALELIHMFQAKQRPRLGELHLGEDGSVTLYTAESGTALHLGRDDFEARLERWDALRAALGERADRLAVVHLDHESKPDRRDRVVARFASEHEDTVLLAQAADARQRGDGQHPGAGASADEPAQPRLPARRAGKRKRIPSYE